MGKKVVVIFYFLFILVAFIVLGRYAIGWASLGQGLDRDIRQIGEHIESAGDGVDGLRETSGEIKSGIEEIERETRDIGSSTERAKKFILSAKEDSRRIREKLFNSIGK